MPSPTWLRKTLPSLPPSLGFTLLVALLVCLALAAASCSSGSGDKTLVVVTHDSFNLDKSLIEQFQKDNGVTVKFLTKGDAGTLTTALVLEKDHEEGDVTFGVDNTFLSRALDAGIFLPYSSPLLNKVPNPLQADAANLATPIDYGWVNFNYDTDALKKANIAPPKTLEDLTDPRFKDLVVVENPATSSPGLAFLIATVDYFGKDNYLGWWSKMKANGLVIVDGWETAYNKNFTLKGGKQPIVLSYASSPPFEQMFAKPPRPDAPTANLLPPKGAFLQVEYAAILKGTQKEALARKFIDFLLSKPAQEDIPGQMAVYPVNSEAAVPEAFAKFGKVDAPLSTFSASEIAKNRDKWIDDWTKAVAR